MSEPTPGANPSDGFTARGPPPWVTGGGPPPWATGRGPPGGWGSLGPPTGAPVTETDDDGSTKYIYIMTSTPTAEVAGGVVAGNSSSVGQGPPIGAIIGGVLGGLAFLLLTIFVALFLRKRRAARLAMVDTMKPIGFDPTTTFASSTASSQKQRGSESDSGHERDTLPGYTGRRPPTYSTYLKSRLSGLPYVHFSNPFSKYPSPQGHHLSPSDASSSASSSLPTHTTVTTTRSSISKPPLDVVDRRESARPESRRSEALSTLTSYTTQVRAATRAPEFMVIEAPPPAYSTPSQYGPPHSYMTM
ncbi:hypothetical protein FA15DRAFT_659475 [Coprinopsis marcescibilis]|uniref:Uncharacterized protein n=1 Tax=Coprinopsis marcescibilis TaxID=230819 RepID=A0A5C3KI81_COPMA|nr:hypothetical protein FA15DRAFT_659475 [Coprinopsis marcescibilis]